MAALPALEVTLAVALHACGVRLAMVLAHAIRPLLVLVPPVMVHILATSVQLAVPAVSLVSG